MDKSEVDGIFHERLVHVLKGLWEHKKGHIGPKMKVFLLKAFPSTSFAQPLDFDQLATHLMPFYSTDARTLLAKPDPPSTSDFINLEAITPENGKEFAAYILLVSVNSVDGSQNIVWEHYNGSSTNAGSGWKKREATYRRFVTNPDSYDTTMPEFLLNHRHTGDDITLYGPYPLAILPRMNKAEILSSDNAVLTILIESVNMTWTRSLRKRKDGLQSAYESLLSYSPRTAD
jgi:hypothetical protein